MGNNTAKNLLEVRGLVIAAGKGGKTTRAVDGISFSVKEEEILGIAGESGCGKTLTALSIAGLLPGKVKIIGGEIEYKNTLLTSMNEKELCKIRGSEISMIFQEYRQSLNPLVKAGRQIREALDLSVKIESGETASGYAKNTQRTQNINKVLKILHRLGFDEPKKIYKAYPHQLSGGMCQRVMAAIAAINCPRLLLADEPSTALDEESQNRILSLLADLNKECGSSILVISHDLSIIRQFCSRYLVMYAGKIMEEGPSQSLFSPIHPYTKALAGAIPDKSKKGAPLETIPGKVPSIDDKLTGCPFAPRCGKAKNKCFNAFPPAMESGDNKKVYCYFPETGGANE